MKIEFKTAEYTYKLIVTLLAIILPKRWMAKTSIFLRQTESKKSAKRKLKKKRDTS